MPARFLLIDGYNLLHAAGMGRTEYGPGDLQRARERLLRYLAAKLTPAEIDRTTVIFDARDPPADRPAKQVFQKIHVEFANPGGDADVVIQDWLDDHSAPKRVTLVSSDHVLQRAARRRRADFVDSEVFFDRLERRRTPGGKGNADAKPRDGLSPSEAAHWMQFFGDLSAVIEAESSARKDRDSTTAESESKPSVEKGDQPNVTRRKRKSRSPDPSKRPKHVSKDDLEEWMEIFRGLPEAEQLLRGKSISQADLERWLKEFDDDRH